MNIETLFSNRAVSKDLVESAYRITISEKDEAYDYQVDGFSFYLAKATELYLFNGDKHPAKVLIEKTGSVIPCGSKSCHVLVLKKGESVTFDVILIGDR